MRNMNFGRSSLCALVACSALAWSYGCSVEETTSSGAGGASSTTSSTTTTPSTSTTTSTTTMSTSSGSMTIQCTKATTTVPKGDCDLLQQDCPAGMVCGVAKEGGMAVSKCQPDKGGLKVAGSACTTNTECKGGMSCVAGFCSPFCCPDTNEPCAGGTCDVNLSFGADKSIYALACSYLPICTLYGGECKNGEECHLTDASACLAVCDAPSDTHVDEGGMCTYRNDCGESQLCNKNEPDMGVCRHFCDTTKAGAEPGKGGCLAGRTCKTVSGTGCTNLGLCLPM